jgi:hypothetical protein
MRGKHVATVDIMYTKNTAAIYMFYFHTSLLNKRTRLIHFIVYKFLIRNSIYTARKPLDHLCKMFDPFFNESRVIRSASVLKVFCFSGTTVLRQRLKARGVILIGVSLTLAGGEATIISAMEACKGVLHRLLEQGLLS